MKVKALLTVFALMAATAAQGAIPLEFRDTCEDAVDGGGHMDYTVDPATGVITLTTNERAGGVYFRTKYITETLPDDIALIAFEYKSTRESEDICVFFHEGWDVPHQFTNGTPITVSDQWQTAFAMIDQRGNFSKNLSECPDNVRDPGSGLHKCYHWISFNDWQNKPGITLQVKNLRYLTIAEAMEYADQMTGDSKMTFTSANSSSQMEHDPDLDCEIIITDTPRGESYNPMWKCGGVSTILPSANTIFTFDYCCDLSSGPIKIMLKPYADTDANATITIPADKALIGLNTESDPDFYPEDESMWRTFSIDLKEIMKSVGFGTRFGSGDYFWVNLPQSPVGNLYYYRNLRLTDSAGGSGIDNVSDDSTPVVSRRYFDLQGRQLKAEPESGLYLRQSVKADGTAATEKIVK